MKKDEIIMRKDVRKRLTLELWYFQYMQLVALVDKKGKSVSEQIRNAITAYLKKEARR